MKKKGKRILLAGSIFVAAFAVWTMLIQSVDVQLVGQNGTSVGFASLNCWFHYGSIVSIINNTACVKCYANTWISSEPKKRKC